MAEQPIPRAPDRSRRKRHRSTPLAQTPGAYLNRVELLTLVPLSMSSIDNLEKGGVFPSRFRLEPTTRVAWKRREIEKWLAKRACKRVHHAPEKLTRSDRCDHFPTPDDLSRVS